MARTPRGGEEAAQRVWLRELPEGEAAQVMGSRANLQRVLTGADPMEIVNRGVPQAYRTTRLGEVAQSQPVSDDRFELPKAGDPHHGLLLNIRDRLGPNQLRAGIAHFGKRIDEHEGWIKDPTSKAGVELHPAQDVARWVDRKWPQDVARLKAQRAIYVAVLKEKEDGIVPGSS